MNKSEPLKLIKSKVMQGGLWGFSLRLINRGLGFARTIILARILSPEDFGLFGLSMLTISALETFSQTGFQAALIQKKDNVESYLDIAWTVTVVRGILLFSILFYCAPAIAGFFNSSQATLVIRVIAVSQLLTGFTNIGIVIFQKELQFGRDFIYQLSGTLANMAAAIILALILRNIWALVWSGLFANLIQLIASYLIHPFRPHFRIDRQKFAELFKFGKWVLASNTLLFFLTQGDDVLVGKLLGITALGFYQMAYTISNLCTTEITHVVSKVTFPAYSKLQDDLDKLRDTYLTVLRFTASLSLPVASIIFILAPGFTKIFLHDHWLPMVPALKALCIFGAVRSIGATMSPILYSLGRPKIQAKISTIHLSLMSIIIYPLSMRWGILGTSIGVIIPNLIILILITIKTKNIIQLRYRDFFANIIRPMVGIFILFFIASLRDNLISECNNLFEISIEALFYIGIYFGLLYLCRKKSRIRIWHKINCVLNSAARRQHG